MTMREFEGEGSLGSKTGEFDESLLLDREPFLFLGECLRRQGAGRRPDQSLFDLDQPTFSGLFRKAGQELGLVDIHPYQLRHTGASVEFASQSRSLAEIKRRGRWKSDTSVRRYEKGGRLSDQLRKLDGRTRSHVLLCGRVIHDVLLRRRPPPAWAGR